MAKFNLTKKMIADNQKKTHLEPPKTLDDLKKIKETIFELMTNKYTDETMFKSLTDKLTKVNTEIEKLNK